MRSVFLPLVAVVVFATGIVAAEADKVDLTLSVRKSLEAGHGYDIAIKNRGERGASYWGYGGEGSMQPVYGIELNDGEAWRKQGVGWCGVGMGPCSVRSGETVRISFRLPDRKAGETVVFRISIRVAEKANSGGEYNRTLYSRAYQLDDDGLRLAFQAN